MVARFGLNETAVLIIQKKKSSRMCIILPHECRNPATEVIEVSY